MAHRDVGRHLDHGGKVVTILPGEHVDLVADAAQFASHMIDVDVLAAGIDTAHHGQGRCMLAHQRDAHAALQCRFIQSSHDDLA